MISDRSWENRIGRRIRLRELHILCIAAESGSMAKAARHLGISQPSVSEAIATLESGVGARLLERSRKGIELTRYGRAIVNRSRAAFDELRQGIQDVEALSDPTSGEVRIACPETLAAGLLPAVIDYVLQKHPRITFDVVQTNVSTIFRDLRERNVDVALARLSNTALGDDLDQEKLFDDRLHIVAGVASRLLRRRNLKLSDLENESWVLIPAETEAGSFIAEALEGTGRTPRHPSVVTFSQHVTHHLLATGRYLAVMPSSVLRFNSVYFSLRPLPIAVAARSRPVMAITLKNRLLSPATSLFIKCAREVTKKMIEV